MSQPPPMVIYAGQDFLTPGAAGTIDLISRTFPLDARSRVLEVAYGTGEGACRLAERHACHVLGVDMHPLAKHVARRAIARGVADLVSFAIGDGGQLPVRDGMFDAAICIGAPSIVGLERCVAAMRRALRPGGMLASSDWVWRTTPVPPEAIPIGVDVPMLSIDDYAGVIRTAGFEIISAEALPRSAWDDYYAPIRRNVASTFEQYPDWEPGQIIEELRVWDSGLGPEWWRYAVFVARAA